MIGKTTTNVQFEIMTEEQVTTANCYGVMETEGYKPSYDELIENSSCEEEAEKWMEAKNNDMVFAFNTVFCMKMKCGHYEIFQTGGIRSEKDIIEWIASRQSEENYHKCTMCVCDF